MDTKHLVTSYQTSLKLKVLGFPQKGYFWWFQTGLLFKPVEIRPFHMVGYKRSWAKNIRMEHALAPTASDLMRHLPMVCNFIGSASNYPGGPQYPGYLCTWKNRKGGYIVAYISEDKPEGRIHIIRQTSHKVYAEALGLMLIELIKGGQFAFAKPLVEVLTNPFRGAVSWMKRYSRKIKSKLSR